MSVELKTSEPMQRLRDLLDAAGIEWADYSEEFSVCDRHVYHMERTRVLVEGFEIASCIWGYSSHAGHAFGMTYGYPDKVEFMRLPFGTMEPEPMAPEQIVNECIKEVRNER